MANAAKINHQLRGKTQLVTFQLGPDIYGMDIMEVVEIHNLSPVRSIPHSPSYVEGIFNLRGQIIPIINLHKRFSLKKAVLNEDEELLSGFVILKVAGKMLGIIIDKILRVVEVDVKDILPPPQMLTGIGTEYIEGVTRSHAGEAYVVVLSARRLFNAEELSQLTLLSPGQRARGAMGPV